MIFIFFCKFRMPFYSLRFRWIFRTVVIATENKCIYFDSTCMRDEGAAIEAGGRDRRTADVFIVARIYCRTRRSGRHDDSFANEPDGYNTIFFPPRPTEERKKTARTCSTEEECIFCLRALYYSNCIPSSERVTTLVCVCVSSLVINTKNIINAGVSRWSWTSEKYPRKQTFKNARFIIPFLHVGETKTIYTVQLVFRRQFSRVRRPGPVVENKCLTQYPYELNTCDETIHRIILFSSV